MSYRELLEAQRKHYHSGVTRTLSFRLEMLERLRFTVKEFESRLFTALQKDLGKNEYEAYLMEIGMVYKEISFAKKHLKSWMKPVRVANPITLFGAKSRIYSEPFGVSLIIAPWNYPVQLLLNPLIGSISAGNCSVLKPSEYTPHVSQVLSHLIEGVFPSEYIAVVEGGVETSKELLELPFDHIFFTGSTSVGKVVMKAAAEHLTPVVLELGGKSPVIVERDANLDLAARRIVWGKFSNSGQTCVAPDYLLVHEEVKSELIQLIQKHISIVYGEDPLASDNFGSIVSQRHFERLREFLRDGEAVVGGKVAEGQLRISPTILDQVSWDSPIMEDEIFGPILPVFTYQSLSECIKRIQQYTKPLALYLFTEDNEIVETVLHNVSFGGGCVNDTVVHLSNIHLPFGGVQHSGQGAYHGKFSFDAFSHRKGIVHQTTRFDPNIRYPLKGNKISLLRWLFR
ncbi:aldehyde dehydrogenase (NAD+) [Thermoactinomyces sp. DSM 45891]|uniref:aldehyde dehydrogenase n=1 Tax=Thermoactinomyces sp. DSM 45891 TaxID=1761907 RepID=UPI00091CD6D1|nr:aldehyde dehydrogenase [Thermoactinomyces sp. DSM 45891]SFX45759.1 aldehyde dehydrogenase (NAD+) [Thermoactinomyces sp. DSM 45891]